MDLLQAFLSLKMNPRNSTQSKGQSWIQLTPHSSSSGTSSAEESSDGSGRVTGKYTLSLADGRQRTVSYWADETGFHADVVTNELGTESKNPADVTVQSSAPTGPEAALAFESQRVKARSSYLAPTYLPAPAAQGFAALRPVHAGFYRKRA